MAGWVYNDGGRRAAGFKRQTSDCVCRAVTIATRGAYMDVYGELGVASRRLGDGSSHRSGVSWRVYRPYLEVRGWRWVPTMLIGTGCRVHLDAAELPSGRLIVRVSRHLTTMIDGVVHDTFDPARDGRRCVYGYFTDQPPTMLERYRLITLRFRSDKTRVKKLLQTVLNL